MRKKRRKTLVLAAFVFTVVALAGMVSTEASVFCPGRQVCVLVNEPTVYSGGNANGVVLYTEPTVEGDVLLECSAAHNDQLHANLFIGGRWYSYNSTIDDRQICS